MLSLNPGVDSGIKEKNTKAVAGTNDDEAADDPLSSVNAPIADLYPATTIMFADVRISSVSSLLRKRVNFPRYPISYHVLTRFFPVTRTDCRVHSVELHARTIASVYSARDSVQSI